MWAWLDGAGRSGAVRGRGVAGGGRGRGGGGGPGAGREAAAAAGPWPGPGTSWAWPPSCCSPAPSTPWRPSESSRRLGGDPHPRGWGPVTAPARLGPGAGPTVLLGDPLGPPPRSTPSPTQGPGGGPGAAPGRATVQAEPQDLPSAPQFGGLPLHWGGAGLGCGVPHRDWGCCLGVQLLVMGEGMGGWAVRPGGAGGPQPSCACCWGVRVSRCGCCAWPWGAGEEPCECPKSQVGSGSSPLVGGAPPEHPGVLPALAVRMRMVFPRGAPARQTCQAGSSRCRRTDAWTSAGFCRVARVQLAPMLQQAEVLGWGS